MTNNDKQQKYYKVQSLLKQKESQRETLIASAFSKIATEVDKIDKDMAKLEDEKKKLHDQIMQGLLESGDLDY